MPSRKRNVFKNIKIGFGAQIASYLLSFITRMVFVRYLSVEYLGINNIFSNVILLFSIAESGAGGVFGSLLYNPLHEHNEQKVADIINYMHTFFRKLAVAISVLAIGMFPFLNWIIGETDIENIRFIYFLFVIKNIFSYLLLHYDTLVSADQRKYLTVLYMRVFSVVQYILQVLFLYLGKGFEIYMIIQTLCAMLPYLMLRLKCRKEYSYIFNKRESQLSLNDKKELKIKIYSGFWTHLSYVIFNGTDSLVITKILGLSVAGIYSNYLVILNVITTFSSILISSLSASVGNFIAEKGKKQVYTVYERLLFAVMILTFFCTGCLICFFNPFIQIWLGEKYLLDSATVSLIALTFAFGDVGFRRLLVIFKWASGLFVRDKYCYVLEAGINVFLSILLGIKYGLPGILGATVLSSLVTIISSVYIMSKYFFEISALKMILNILIYIVSFAPILIGMYYLQRKVIIDSMGNFVVSTVFLSIIMLMLMLLANCWRKELKYFLRWILRRKEEV